MNILSIYFQMWAKILQNWWPVILFIVLGLAVLVRAERREKLNDKKI